jgi:hypothetical protein
MFRLLCFAIIRLLHYLLDTYMCKTVGCDILVISRESVAGNEVGMIRIISKFILMFYCLVLHWCTVPRLHAFSSYRSCCATSMSAGIKLLAFVMPITARTLSSCLTMVLRNLQLYSLS